MAPKFEQRTANGKQRHVNDCGAPSSCFSPSPSARGSNKTHLKLNWVWLSPLLSLFSACVHLLLRLSFLFSYSSYLYFSSCCLSYFAPVIFSHFLLYFFIFIFLLLTFLILLIYLLSSLFIFVILLCISLLVTFLIFLLYLFSFSFMFFVILLICISLLVTYSYSVHVICLFSFLIMFTLHLILVFRCTFLHFLFILSPSSPYFWSDFLTLFLGNISFHKATIPRQLHILQRRYILRSPIFLFSLWTLTHVKKNKKGKKIE